MKECMTKKKSIIKINNMVYLNKHLIKYPLMKIEDILKLHLQGILGPAHLVSNKELVLKNITNEYIQIKDDLYKDELIEEISDKYVRVYLKPYYETYKSFNNLVEAFYLSSLIKEDTDEFVNQIKKLINEENKDYINNYLNKGNYLISHSTTYKENYHPHYLVINKKYINIAINKY
jgi:hypothetical protein